MVAKAVISKEMLMRDRPRRELNSLLDSISLLGNDDISVIRTKLRKEVKIAN